MDLTPMFEAPLSIQVHFLTVVPAFFLGTYLLFVSKKGSPIHRLLGKFYLVLMTTTAIVALFIRAEGGPTVDILGLRFGLIHLFVVLTLSGVYNAIMGVRLGDIKRHRQAMIGTYVGGLLIAGSFAFAPGRLMHTIFFT